MKILRTTLLLLHQSTEVVDMLAPILNSLFETVHFAHIEKEEAKLIGILEQEHKSLIFAHAFESPKDALNSINKLKKLDVFQAVVKCPNFDILFCDKVQRENAFKLCEKEVFYTYETFKPIYDINKIKLTLIRLSQHLESQVDLLEVESENKEMGDNIKSSIESIEALQQNVAKQAGESAKEFEHITSPLDTLLAHVPPAEWEKAFTRIVRALPESVQRSSVDSFSLQAVRDHLEHYKNNSVQMLNALAESLDCAKPQLVSKKTTVIVADDQPVIQKIISNILERRGFKVELANNGVEAVMKAKVMEPSLILLDIDMPIMDGFAALQAIKEVDGVKNVPVMMLTSHSDKEMIQSCIQHGAVDYVVKPTSAKILLGKILKVINL
ncbi:response regulator [Pseudoalteromonas luteoviolacea]|uniref:Response regulatory domain-containing protein n=1 Tax=Pseudoalteromonas luteoviolacea S4054 TaxID=1129367 RepID=A0A0F6A645_9GAMM|nr:response regulator [Pseudoalteromonas luteoviolacea]AOT08155.1 hypothetical protein S4054249_09990 [Pseudoalteromonas luteoviolacea]AOT13072.1 hypothetical protein S40542_09990 [Pseudoalteromonas luteoviolacea]AOT17984.1 hypothetical protein S4054_09985 [Pseudoalteromonas luteoviolacea]KKE81645.1 hypothetical protein N479_21730 [Pseudoalteromonas luteoviolacea S4054]KZN69478.1 hypothetical protein N481_22060 [Pseudoalteromonas luteoviolacea S4047-1]